MVSIRRSWGFRFQNHLTTPLVNRVTEKGSERRVLIGAHFIESNWKKRFQDFLTLKWPRYFYSRWCPRGGVPRDPTVENHFPTGIVQWNLHHICINYKKSQFCKKKNENVVPFQNGGQITDFYFTSFRFWPKFEKPLSQRNFSMKFGSK